ncbi:MAG TPA: cytochrome P450 [Thermoanaerobaculia bacterium]|nr:cytochrome P450 [Thermoanaerobaculia bacterium]
MTTSSEIPRPTGSLISHSLRFAKNTMRFYEEAYRECGDIFATRVAGLGNWVYVCSPELARSIFEAPPEVIARGDIEGFSLAHLLGKGAASHADGPAHRERRDVTAPYLGAQASQRHVDDVRGITERRLQRWPRGKPFPLVLELQRIALESLITMFFGGADAGRVHQLADLYESFSFKGLRSPASVHPSLQIDLGPWSPWGRVKRRQRELVKVFSQEIDARLAAVKAVDAVDAGVESARIDRPEPDDLVQGMARARLGDGSRLSREVILAEILDLLFQGHELTGDSMTWTLGELATHPEVLARLRQELDSVAGEEGVRSAHLAALPYLEAVVYEGLRRRPSNFFTGAGRVKQPLPLGGYLLAPGTLVAVCYPAVAMREDLFANPRGFAPEHFLGKQPPAGACPFGGGPHACAGKDLAIMVMKVALATIVRQAELKLAQDEVRPVRNAYFYEPNKGLLVTLEDRTSRPPDRLTAHGPRA